MVDQTALELLLGQWQLLRELEYHTHNLGLEQFSDIPKFGAHIWVLCLMPCHSTVYGSGMSKNPQKVGRHVQIRLGVTDHLQKQPFSVFAHIMQTFKLLIFILWDHVKLAYAVFLDKQPSKNNVNFTSYGKITNFLLDY